jgi:hypothetical protein
MLKQSVTNALDAQVLEDVSNLHITNNLGDCTGGRIDG